MTERGVASDTLAQLPKQRPNVLSLAYRISLNRTVDVPLGHCRIDFLYVCKLESLYLLPVLTSAHTNANTIS